jgi:uncharacterized protein YcgI (DUF1989 family)
MRRKKQNVTDGDSVTLKGTTFTFRTKCKKEAHEIPIGSSTKACVDNFNKVMDEYGFPEFKGHLTA